MTDKEVSKLVEKQAAEYMEKMAAADPITWGTIMKYVGTAVVKAALGEVFMSLFKSGVDYKNLIRNLLKDVDRLISLRIDQAFINQSVNKMGSVEDAMADYLNQLTKETFQCNYNSYLH